jgi:hypothetical protein
MSPFEPDAMTRDLGDLGDELDGPMPRLASIRGSAVASQSTADPASITGLLASGRGKNNHRTSHNKGRGTWKRDRLNTVTKPSPQGHGRCHVAGNLPLSAPPPDTGVPHAQR